VVVNNMEDVLPYYYGHSYYQDSYQADDGDSPPRPRQDRGKGRREGSSGTTRPSSRARAAGSS